MLSRHEARQHSAFVSRRNFEQEGNIISEPLFGLIAEVINLDNKTAITFDLLGRRERTDRDVIPVRISE